MLPSGEPAAAALTLAAHRDGQAPCPHHMEVLLSHRQAVTSSSSLTASSPNKRKDAPQPEAELLCCTEEPVPALPDGTLLPPASSRDRPLPLPAGASATPATGRPPGLLHTALADMALRPTGGTPGTAAAGTAGGSPGTALANSTTLTVAPLDLSGLQLVPRPGDGAALRLPASSSGLAASAAAAAAGAGSALWRLSGGAAAGPPGASSSIGGGMTIASNPIAMLPPDLLPRPFSLGTNVLHVPASLFEPQPMPRLTYARPPKRRERLPIGESDDSNASTDSNAATNGDAGAWHEEDDGGTVTAATTATNSTGTTALAPSSSPSTGGTGLVLPPALLQCAAETEQQHHHHRQQHHHYQQQQQAADGTPSLSYALSGGNGLLGSTGGMDGGMLSAVGAQQLQLQLQLQLPAVSGGHSVILLQTQRSKGPRSRAASATPSSSSALS